MANASLTHAASADRRKILALGTALLACRLPYVAAGHIQEDAFISWRVARVLVDTGTWGFNPGETVSASSSHLYVLLCALVRLTTGAWFIPAVTLVNCLLTLAAVLALARVAAPAERPLALWGMASLLPVALQISYSGMETALLVFLIAALVAGSASRDRLAWPAIVAAVLLPWTRPDAIVWPIVCAIGIAWSHRRTALQMVALAFASGVAVTLFNLTLFGSIVNQTVIAKHVASGRAFDPATIASRLSFVFIGDRSLNAAGAFLPVATRHVIPLGAVALLLVVAASVYWLWRMRHQRDRFSTFIALAGLAFVPPTAYAVGGVLFPWYMWPSSLVAGILILAAVFDIAGRQPPTARRLLWHATGWSIGALALAQWALAFHWGDAQGRFLTDVGRAVQSAARSGDTLLLEPAGYIPYYSGLHTDDEIGLVSPKVTTCRATGGVNWWIQFVARERPTFLVERAHMREFTTYDRYRLTPDEQAWFEHHYQLVRSFRYDPAAYHRNPRVVDLLRRLASAPDELLLYRRRAAEDSAPRGAVSTCASVGVR